MRKGQPTVVTDRCWTLAPLSILSALLVVLMSKNSAILYVAFIDEFGVSHQSASWPTTVCIFMVQFSGFLVSLLQKRLSIYHIAIAGSLLNFVAFIAASFAPNIVCMTITVGVLSGAAQGIVVLTLSIYAMVYFDKYRAAASGFKYTGMSLAPLVFSMPLSICVQTYGLHGALLIVSALTLNTLPIAMLMNNPRPVKFSFGKNTARSRSSSLQVHTTAPVRNTTPSSPLPSDSNNKAGTSQITPICSLEGNIENRLQENCASVAQGQLGEASQKVWVPDKLFVSEAAVPQFPDIGSDISSKDERTLYNIAPRDIYRTQQVLFGRYSPSSIFVLPHPEPFLEQDRSDKGPPLGRAFEPAQYAQNFKDSMHSGRFDANLEIRYRQCAKPVRAPRLAKDLGLLKNPVFYLLVCLFGLLDYISNTFETTILDYAVDKGATKSQALPIVTYVAASEIAGRLSLPFIWDSMRLRRSLLVALCLLGASASFIAMPHAASLGDVVATGVVTGITTGCVTAMKPVLLTDSLGVCNLSLCWGICGIVMLPLHVGGPLLIGAFRDSMGSYDNLYRMLSALCILFSLLTFGLPYFQRRRQNVEAS